MIGGITVSANGTPPILRPGCSRSGRPAITFTDGNGQAMKVDRTDAARLVATLDGAAYTVMAVFSGMARHASSLLCSASAGGDGGFGLGLDYNENRRLGAWNNRFAGVPFLTDEPSGFGTLVHAAGAGEARIYINQGCVAITNTVADTRGNGWALGGFFDTQATSYLGDLYEVIVWPSTLTPGQVVAAHRWACDQHGERHVPLEEVAHGDSLTAATGSCLPEHAWIAKLAAARARPIGTWSNLGRNGQTMRQMIDRFATEIAPLKPATAVGRGPRLHVFEWANQEHGGAPRGLSDIDATRRYLARAKAAGFETVLLTSTDWDSAPPDFKQARQLYDRHFDDASHRKGLVDVYVPLHTLPTVGVAGTSRNPTYFKPDALHLTGEAGESGQGEVARAVTAALAART